MLHTATTNEKGVHVDLNLTFEHHVEDVVNKANRMLDTPAWLDRCCMDIGVQYSVPRLH